MSCDKSPMDDILKDLDNVPTMRDILEDLPTIDPLADIDKIIDLMQRQRVADFKI